MKFICLLIFFAACIFGTRQDDITKVDIILFYEFLCGGCHYFILKQLVPNYDGLKDYMDLLIVPFGNAKILHNKTIECQHGPEECKGNRVQSCVFNTIPIDVKKQLEFAECQFNKGFDADPLVSAKECVEKLHLDWDSVQSCYDGQLGTDLQMDAGKLTNSFKNRQWVPWIIYNNISNEKAQDRFSEDFKREFCHLIHNKAPVCKSGAINLIEF